MEQPVFLEVTTMQGKPMLVLLQSIFKILPLEEPHRSTSTLIIAWQGQVESLQIRETYKQMKERMLKWSTFLEMGK